MASTAQLTRAGRGVLGQIWEAVETRNRTVGRMMDETDPPLQVAPVQPCFPRTPPPPCPGLDAGTHVQAAVSNLQGGEGAPLRWGAEAPPGARNSGLLPAVTGQPGASCSENLGSGGGTRKT